MVQPAPPEHLDLAAAAKWRDLAPRLSASGILTDHDLEALEMLCGAWSRYLAATAMLRKKDDAAQCGGIVLKSVKTGALMISPYLVVAQRELKLVKELLAEFGLTPSSRSRVLADGKSKTGEAAGKAKYFRSG